MNLLLNIYGSPFTYGWLPEGATRVPAESLLEAATSLGLQGVELPTPLIDLADAHQLARIRAMAAESDLELVLSAADTQPEFLLRAIDAAQQLGCAVLRTVVGGARLGGDRREYLGRWPSFLDTLRERFERVLEPASQSGVAIAVENHQDLTSEELLQMCETFDSPFFGVNLDTANALGVGELPLEFAKRVARHVKHVHLKDYRIYLSGSGYRLARCPAGAGVVPFGEIVEVLQAAGYARGASIELGATEARHVRLLEPDFWPEYPDRSAEQLAGVMKFVLDHARPAQEDYRTPHERGAPPADLVRFEQAEWDESFAYLSQLPEIALEGGPPAASPAGAPASRAGTGQR